VLAPTPAIECLHADRCAGCPLIHEPYSAQLAKKQAALAHSLSGYRELSALAPTTIVAAEPVLGYRLRAKLVAEGSALGLYARGSHAVVDIPHCRVLSPVVARSVAAVRAKLPFAFPLLALDVREADRGTLLTLIVPQDANEASVRRTAEALMKAEPEILGVSLSRRAVRSAQVLGSAPVPLVGLASAPHRLDPGAPFHEAVPGGFVQAHAAQTNKLHSAIEAALSRALGGLRGRQLLELYAGAGALSLRLAAKGAKVSAVDSFGPGLSRLERVARAQKLELKTRALSAEEALASGERPDAVLVDPPRRGLSQAVRRAIAELRPRALVYVSCEPKTLARDLFHFRHLGLEVAELSPWDMIPQSESVETLALLKPGQPPALRVLHEDATLLAVEHAAIDTNTRQGDYPGSMLRRIRELPGNAEAVLVPGLEPDVSGICLVARRPLALPELSQALLRGKRQYLALVRGIIRGKGRVERPARDGRAATRYRRERVVGTHSLVRAFPEPGQRSQLRQHLGSIDHPVLGDTRFGDAASNRYFEERHGLDRPFLHCARLELELAGATITIESELAADLAQVLESLAAPPSVEHEEAAPRRE
jgi:23S rRNA (uracil1939-C5)-methyltransferase